MKEFQDVDSKEQGSMALNIIHFSRLLRSSGMQVGPASAIDAVDALCKVTPHTREDFYWILHCIFVKRRDQNEVFQDAFNLFWRSPKVLEQLIAELLSPNNNNPSEEETKEKNELSRRVLDALQESYLNNSKNEIVEEKNQLDMSMSFSSVEFLQTIDFDKMTVEELYAAKKAISLLRFPIEETNTRRFRPNIRGIRIDMRSTLRSHLKAGGELYPPKKCINIKRPPPIVVLCDISGSMNRYSRMFLHFLHAISSDRDKVSVFIFGTRLTNITRFLRQRDVDHALDLTSRATEEWSGGTRIGECLRQFNYTGSRRVQGQGPTVLLITDGLDRDDLSILEKEISRLQKSCRSLMWLNPLLRYENFKAEAGGIRTMLPYVDEFRSAHNLQSLMEISEVLSGIKSS